MPSKNDSTAAVAFDFVMPVSCAIFAISSCLFMLASGANGSRVEVVKASAPRVIFSVEALYVRDPRVSRKSAQFCATR